jgi:hypothetical protein
MIDGMNAIITQVRNFNSENLKTGFFQNGDSLEDARVLFFGEEHTEIIGQIESLGALNFLAKPTDMLLLEGQDKKIEISIDCALFLIFQLYVNWEWEKFGAFYDVANVKRKNEWVIRNRFNDLLASTHRSYDLSDLNLSKLRCGFWDDAQAIRDTIKDNRVTHGTMERRNKSMTGAISTNLKDNAGRVIVSSGYRHMPITEYFVAQAQNQNNSHFPKELAQFYRQVKEIRSSGQLYAAFKLDELSGSTLPIFEYFKGQSIPFREYLHRRLYRLP